MVLHSSHAGLRAAVATLSSTSVAMVPNIPRSESDCASRGEQRSFNRFPPRIEYSQWSTSGRNVAGNSLYARGDRDVGKVCRASLIDRTRCVPPTDRVLSAGVFQSSHRFPFVEIKARARCGLLCVPRFFKRRPKSHPRTVDRRSTFDSSEGTVPRDAVGARIIVLPLIRRIKETVQR